SPSQPSAIFERVLDMVSQVLPLIGEVQRESASLLQSLATTQSANQRIPLAGPVTTSHATIQRASKTALELRHSIKRLLKSLP
ncbi:hypothetical protein PENTCL1PPCAC_22451, partial [Pristionchus entomophagus]